MLSMQEKKPSKIYYYSTLTFMFSVALNLLITFIIFLSSDSNIPPFAYLIGASISYFCAYLITDFCKSLNQYVKGIFSIILDIAIASITYIVSISLMFGTKALSSYNIDQCKQAENGNNALKGVTNTENFQCEILDFSSFLTLMDSFSSSPFGFFSSPIYFTIFLFIFVHVFTFVLLVIYGNFFAKSKFYLMP